MSRNQVLTIFLASKGISGSGKQCEHHSASGKIKCITERLHNNPQQGTQAQPDSARRKFCVYSLMASCWRLTTAQLYMETHIWGNRLKSSTGEMEKHHKQKEKTKAVTSPETCVPISSSTSPALAVRHFCFDPEPLQAAC